MDNTLIVIPTRGRTERQLTYRYLPESLRPSTILVAPRNELAALRARCPEARNIVAQPDHIDTIAKKRAWILGEMPGMKGKKVIMLDDDLAFFVRCAPKDRYFDDAAGYWKVKPEAAARGVKLARVATAVGDRKKVAEAFGQWSKLLDKYAHVGMGSRLGNHYERDEIGYTQRHVHALGYRVDTWRAVVKPNRVNLKEDFDYNLQLLRAGHDNAQIHYVFVGPGAYGSPGGCTEERARVGHDAAAVKLAQLHPELVRVVKRNYQGIPRLEVVVRWQKAFGFDRG